YITKLISDVITEALKHGLIPAGDKLDFKVQLPSIIKADAAARGTMIRHAEGMAYISKQTAAEQFAGEAEIADYDYDAEQQRIRQETGQDPQKLIMKDVEMVAKGQPTPAEPAFPPGSVPNPSYTGPAQPPKPSSNGHSGGV